MHVSVRQQRNIGETEDSTLNTFFLVHKFLFYPLQHFWQSF